MSEYLFAAALHQRHNGFGLPPLAVGGAIGRLAQAALAQLGVPKEQIKTEALGPARSVAPGTPRLCRHVPKRLLLPRRPDIAIEALPCEASARSRPR